jgi:hypothetical protein
MQSTVFLPEIKTNEGALAVDGEVHVNDLPTRDQKNQGVRYNVELLIELQSVNYLHTLDQIRPMGTGHK